jgi:hypothetical protein
MPLRLALLLLFPPSKSVMPGEQEINVLFCRTGGWLAIFMSNFTSEAAPSVELYVESHSEHERVTKWP